jgi:hypothetical protein
MEVEVHDSDQLIGTAILDSLDPPMGIASGSFSPSEGYSRDKHANEIDGEFVGDKGESLSLRAAGSSVVLRASFGIEDWADSSLGRYLTVWFEDGGDYAARFSEHPHYRAYYPKSNGS